MSEGSAKETPSKNGSTNKNVCHIWGFIQQKSKAKLSLVGVWDSCNTIVPLLIYTSCIALSTTPEYRTLNFH